MEFNSVTVTSYKRGSEAKHLIKIDSSQSGNKERKWGPNSLGLFGKTELYPKQYYFQMLLETYHFMSRNYFSLHITMEKKKIG